MTLRNFSQYKKYTLKMTSSWQLIDNYLWSWCFATTPININPFWFSTKICHKAAFTINKQYSKSTIKVPRKSAKICPKLTKTFKQHDRHCCGIPVVKQTLVCRVDVPLVFKNIRRKKKVYNKCKSEKIRKAHSPPPNRSENEASCQNC